MPVLAISRPRLPSVAPSTWNPSAERALGDEADDHRFVVDHEDARHNRMLCGERATGAILRDETVIRATQGS